MYVDEERCAGCGACQSVCPTNAIRLVNDRAKIDAALCNNCLACVPVCPSAAIIVTLPTVVSSARAVRTSGVMPPTQVLPTLMGDAKTGLVRAGVIAPALGAALTFLGRQVVPRVAAAIVETMLNHNTLPSNPQSIPIVRLAHQRRLRRRGGRVA